MDRSGTHCTFGLSIPIRNKNQHRPVKIAQESRLSKVYRWDRPVTLPQTGQQFFGGQKQRLEYSAAPLVKPLNNIYFLDDSFFGDLDYQTDAKFTRALKSYVRDSAVVIVAQRVATCHG